MAKTDTPRSLPGFNGVYKVPLADFKEKHGIVDVMGVDGGMYGNLYMHFFLKEDPTKLYVCHAYQSSGFSTNYTCDYNIAEEVHWGKNGGLNNQWDLPENAAEFYRQRASTTFRQIQEEIRYIGRRQEEYAKAKMEDGFSEEQFESAKTHIDARTNLLGKLYAERDNYLKLSVELAKTLHEGA